MNKSKDSWWRINASKKRQKSSIELSKSCLEMLKNKQLSKEENNLLVETIIKDKKDEDCWKLVLGNIKFVLHTLQHYSVLNVNDTVFMGGVYGFFRAAKKIDRVLGWKTYAITYIFKEASREIISNNSQISPLYKDHARQPIELPIWGWGISEHGHYYPDAPEENVSSERVEEPVGDQFNQVVKVDDCKLMNMALRNSIHSINSPINNKYLEENFLELIGYMDDPKVAKENVKKQKHFFRLKTMMRCRIQKYISANPTIEKELELILKTI